MSVEVSMSQSNEPIKKEWHNQYVDLLANPLDFRSDVDFCKEVGVELNTFKFWKYYHRDQIFEEADKRRKKFSREIRASYMKEVAKAMRDSFNDRKLMAQLLGDLVERTESRTELLTHDDKVRRANALLENISKRKTAWNAEKTQGERGSKEGGETPTVPQEAKPDNGSPQSNPS